jgi:ankyrin repeat protein
MKVILLSIALIFLSGCRLKLKEEVWHGPAHDGNISELKRLLNSGLDVNTRDERGDTPVYTALAAGQYKAADFLVSRGAIINTKDREGIGHTDHLVKVNPSKELRDWFKRNQIEYRGRNANQDHEE